MRKLIVFCLSFYLVSCATSTSSDSGSGSDNTITETTPTADTSAREPLKSTEEKSEQRIEAAPVAASMYSALNDAVKSQSDESIHKAASEILMQNPKDIRGLNALAMVNYKRGRFDAAQYLLNKAIAVNGATSELHSNLGLVLLAKNEKKEAVRSFRKAIDVNSKDAIAGANLGSIYVQEKDYNKALFALEIPVKKGMKDAKIMNNYAIALAATGKAKEAADIYEKILKENASHREVMLNYSILLIEDLQKNKEGLDLLNRLKFVGAPAEARDTIKNLENKAKAGLQ